MLIKEITLTNQGGLHARPATFFVHLCSTFQSKIEIALNDKIANAKSLISVMALGAGRGKSIRLIADGCDEELVMEKVTDFFQNLTD